MTADEQRSGDQTLSRRTVLRAAAASAVGSACFVGTASAEGPKSMQVNFCGCSQVCVVREEDDNDESFTNNADDAKPSNEVGPNTVILARETDSGWVFDN